MSKQVKFVKPRNKDKADFHAKTMSHSTYRCKRKPNSKLCKNGAKA